jgi:hypothetical protein
MDEPMQNSEYFRLVALDRIEEAIQAVRAYGAATAREIRTTDVMVKRRELKDHATILLKEAYLVGGPGQPCHCCGGSGRE